MMKSQPLLHPTTKTDEECMQEVDRLITEIVVMQKETRRMSEESERIAEHNRQARQKLRKLLLCGNK